TNMASRFKLVFFCPRPSTQAVLKSLFAAFPRTVGRIGLYEGCAFVSPGQGQFRPPAGANPTIGTPGQAEFVDEDRVEVMVSGERDTVKTVIEELKKAHPYEEVAYDVYKLEDL
ncbi:hypothetical protein AURDEDRAFT_60348, partial [Auricularia subglabra TFB-10046 SS5]